MTPLWTYTSSIIGNFHGAQIIVSADTKDQAVAGAANYMASYIDEEVEAFGNTRYLEADPETDPEEFEAEKAEFLALLTIDARANIVPAEGPFIFIPPE